MVKLRALYLTHISGAVGGVPINNDPFYNNAPQAESGFYDNHEGGAVGGIGTASKSNSLTDTFDMSECQLFIIPFVISLSV